MTKQLHKIIEDKTSEVVFGDILDAATVEGLAEHFYYRYACEYDEKFIFFLQRNMKELKRRYEDLLELESGTYDPLVIDLKNRSLEITNANGFEDTNTRTINGLVRKLNNITKARTSSITGSNETSGTSAGTANYSSQDGNTRTNNLHESSSTEGKERQLHSDTPQANVSSSTVGDLDDPITWTYASDLRDGYNKDESETSNTGTVTDSGSSSGNSSNSTTTSGETTTQQDGSENGTEEHNGSITDETTITDEKTREATGSAVHDETVSGRGGHLISEILLEWERYIKDTDAFLWLCKNLERCFISNLLYGEEDFD